MEEHPPRNVDAIQNVGGSGVRKKEPTSLVVTHLPTDVSKREVEDFLGELGRIRRCHLVRDKEWNFKGMVYVQYSHSEEAAKAKKLLNRKNFKGSRLKVKFSRDRKKEQKLKEVQSAKKGTLKDEHFGEEYVEKPKRKKKKDRSKYGASKEVRKMRQGRIIVRNLSFKVDEQALEEHFSPYGKLTEVKVIRKDEKKIAGFAFLQYETRLQALKAIQECNMKPILGRPVVVDLAVPKTQFQTPTVKVEDSDIKVEESDVKEEMVDIKEEIEAASKGKTKDLIDYTEVKVKEEKLSDDNDSGMEESESDSEMSSVDDEDEDEDDDDDEDEDEDDDDDDETSDDDEDFKTKKKKKQKLQSVDTKPKRSLEPSKDVEEERSVFLKNVSFDASEKDISALLSQFGEVKRVCLVIDPLTEHPRGTAFAEFKTQEGASSCLAAVANPEDTDQFTLHGRQVQIMKALSKGSIDGMKDNTEKKNKDKRNLYLAREGFIRPGTLPAKGVSQADMILRQKREAAKRSLLKNLNVFVSDTRLCVNNLPEDLDDRGLRKIFLKYSAKGAKITEARIMRYLADVGPDGKARSRGYGFVTFTEHKDALAALRKMNNNPSVFTSVKRPIIEFSLENREILNAKRKRQEKSKDKNPTFKKGKQIKGYVSSTKAEGEVDENADFMGSKADPNVGVKNALTTSIGPKIRQGKKGTITRKILKKQRQDRQKKNNKRIRVLDEGEISNEPNHKKSKEERKAVKKNKARSKKFPRKLRTELHKEKSFTDMVKQYKQKMSAVNSESSSKRWFED